MPHSALVLDGLARLRRIKSVAERGTARVRFTLAGRTCPSVLPEDQVVRYRREGCLLVSGLIPREVIRAAEAALWEALGASADVPESWSRLGPQPHVLRDARLSASYTDDVLAAAAQLASDHVAGFLRPERAFTINRVPRSGEWKPCDAHLDHSLAANRNRTFPRSFRIGSLTYLTDVKPHGGGTIVWPGSHVAVEALARSDPQRYEMLTALNADLGLLGLGAGVELTPSRGDVLFLDPFCVHAGSDNVSGTPRLALSNKW